MNKLLLLLMAGILFSCADNRTAESESITTDTLMDTTTIKMKADTTAKMLDNLEDSINKLRSKAADQKD